MEVLEDMSLRQESGTKGPWSTAAGLQQLPRQAVHPGCSANQGPGLREPSEFPLEPLPQLTEASVYPGSGHSFL